MPKFLDKPSWYNSSGQLEDIDDYSKIYKFTTTSGAWVPITQFQTDTLGRIMGYYNGRMQLLSNIGNKARLLFKKSIDIVSGQEWRLFPIIFLSSDIRWENGAGTNTITVTDGSMFEEISSSSSNLMLYNSSGQWQLSSAKLTSKYTDMKFSLQQSSSRLAKLFNILFDKFEIYSADGSVQTVNVDCEYLYNEIKALK